MKRFPALFFFLFLSVLSLHGETIVVLPFFNHTANANLDWIGESIAENLREVLNSEGGIAVPREDLYKAYRRLGMRPYALLTKASVMKIGEAVDSSQIVYGEFELTQATTPDSRGSLRIVARIVDLRKLRSGGDFLAVGALEDLAALQRHLAWQTLQFLLPENSPSEEEFRQRRTPVRVDAMEYYIRGLLASNAEQKHHFFTQAARLDPAYPGPPFELGRMHIENEEFGSAAEWLERVKPGASCYWQALFLLGIARYHTGNFEGAQEAFRTVAAEVPLNEVWNNLGVAQLRRNQPQALESFQKALDGDENDPDYLFNAGYAYWKRGEFERAAEKFRAALARDPEDDDATLLLARSVEKSGPRPGDGQSEGLERLKFEFEESAYRQLRSILEANRERRPAAR